MALAIDLEVASAIFAGLAPYLTEAEVAAVGASAKGPDVGRASGLKNARVSGTAPRSPTLACAKEERPGLLVLLVAVAGRFCGS